MMKQCIKYLLFVVPLVCFGQVNKTIEGVVFVDENANGIYDSGEQLLSNIGVSNGQNIVTTDAKGAYKIEKIQNYPVFLIKPSGYISKVDNGRRYFFASDAENLKDYSFPLYPNKEPDSLQVALLGDPQADIIDDVYHVGKLVVEELVDNKPDFIVPLGDLSFDNLDIFDPLSKTLGLINSPIFYVMGNHDMDYHQELISNRDRTFKSFFGPSYYAFEFGEQLFLVLNNIYPTTNKDYVGKIDDMQKEFINHLIELKKDQFETIKIFMHIPVEEMEDKDAFIALFKDFKEVFIATGHTHTQYQKYFNREEGKSQVHELVAGAVCGAWWQGPHDLNGIPFALMYDGTPKGYWFLDTNKASYKLRYKVSGAPFSKQMQITVPENREWDTALNVLNEPYIYANVFSAPPETSVEVSFDENLWIPMELYNGISPVQKRLYKIQELGRYKNAAIGAIPKPIHQSKHLWRLNIPTNLAKGVHLIKVRAHSKLNNYSISDNAVLWIN